MSDPAGLSLVGGVLALDFANTVSWRGTAREVDHLASAADVLKWSLHAGAVGSAQAARIGSPPELLRHAHRLRAAILGIGAAIAAGAPVSDSDLSTLRDLAAQWFAVARLSPNGAAYALDFSAAPPIPAVLGPVAWSAIQLLQQDELGRLKQCPAPDCGWLFLDRSKNASRRWCDMAHCGNRAKGRRHRTRG